MRSWSREEVARVRWLAVELLGAGSLVGGVGLQWGRPWALMAFGVLLIGVSMLRALRLKE